MSRVVWITNMVAPYRHRIYAALDQTLNGGLTLIIPAAGEPDRSWPGLPDPCPVIRLPGLALPRGEGRRFHLCVGASRALEKRSAEVVLLSGFGPPMLSGLWWARRHKVPVVACMDGWAQSDSPLTRWNRHFLLRHMTAGLAIGKKSRAWLSINGMPKTYTAPLLPIVPPPDSRKRFEDRDIDVLWVAALQNRKGADRFAAIVRHMGGRRIVIAGDGPLKDRVRAELPHADFLGQLPPDQAAELPRRARVVLIPSRYDAWPLSASEAAQAGAVVVISERCGAAEDLIRDGREGIVLPGDETKAWRHAINALLADPVRWETLSANAYARAARDNFTVGLETHIQVISDVLACRSG